MNDQLPQAPEAITKASKEIMALHTGAELKPVIPTTLEEAFRYAQLVCQAGLAPKSYEISRDDSRPDPQKVVVGILTALELGVPPLQGLSGIAIINGRPSVWGDLAVGLVQSRGLIEKHEVLETGTYPNDDFTITVRFWRRGQAKPYEGRFSIADAKKARLWGNPKKQPWLDYPRRMVFNRARAFPLRDGFSDALKGLSIAEEVLDMTTDAPKPVDAQAFLTDDTPSTNAAQAASDTVAPLGQETAETPPATAVGADTVPEAVSEDDLAEFGAYLDVLATVETVVRLNQLAAEVKDWLAAAPIRETLRGQWNAAKIERQKVIEGRKTK